MTALAEVRPAGLDLLFRPGTTVTVELLWPAGSLAGRTFSSTLAGASLPVVIAGDTLTLVADPAATALPEGVPVAWQLLEDRGSGPEPIMVGEWTPSNAPQAVTTGTFQVVLGTATVQIQVTSALGAVRPPTVVIAAADAPADVKAAADVVCDGVDDNVEIRAALDAGRPVVLSEGTFWINGHVGQRVLMPSGAVLRGQGPQQTVIRLQPADLGNEALFPPFDSWGVVGTQGAAEAPVEDVTLADLTIDGNQAEMVTNGNANQGECFDGKHTVRLKVTNVHVVNANADGFDLDFCSGVLTNVSALDCRGNGIHLSGGFPAGDDETATRWVVVQGADIEGCGYGFLRGAFDVTEDSAYNVIQGITCRGNRATFSIAGNRNIITNVFAADEHVSTVSGDGNVLANLNLSVTGFDTVLAMTGSYNAVTNARLSGVRGFAVRGTGNTLTAITEVDTLTGSDIPDTAVAVQVADSLLANPPTNSSPTSRYVNCRTPEGSSENRGTATIPDGETSDTTVHGPWATPAAAPATPRALDQVAVTARDATNITISRAGTTGTLEVDWSAHL